MNISDIQAEIRALCDADSTSLTDATLLRRVNAAYEDVVGKIIGNDGTWQFDDTNYTDLPIGTTNLVNGQQDYSFLNSQLEIERVEVLDNAGIWHLLTPIDKGEIPIALSQYLGTNGLPMEYDKQGGSIFLYPIPATANVTITSGLKVYFQRTANLFTSADVSTGTKQPGFASPFHPLIYYKAALPYCLSYKKDRVPLINAEIARIEEDMLTFFSRRTKDVRPRLTVSTNRIGNASGMLNAMGADSNK